MTVTVLQEGKSSVRMALQVKGVLSTLLVEIVDVALMASTAAYWRSRGIFLFVLTVLLCFCTVFL